MIAVLLAAAMAGTTPQTSAPPSQACFCHNAIDPQGKAPVLDLLRWELEGVHRGQGCVGCHPKAGTLPHPPSLPQPVCAPCHQKEDALFKESVHRRAQPRGKELAGCQTCHAEHPFYANEDPRGWHFRGGLLRTCAACHAPMRMDPLLRLTLKPLPPEGGQWPPSIHGLIAAGDQRLVSNCVSCHGNHALFPKTDTRALVAPVNIKKICGECHPGIEPAAIAGRICNRPGALAGLARNYFNLWYLWFGGIGVLTALVLIPALVVRRVVLKRRGA